MWLAGFADSRGKVIGVLYYSLVKERSLSKQKAESEEDFLFPRLYRNENPLLHTLTLKKIFQISQNAHFTLVYGVAAHLYLFGILAFGQPIKKQSFDQ